MEFRWIAHFVITSHHTSISSFCFENTLDQYLQISHKQLDNKKFQSSPDEARFGERKIDISPHTKRERNIHKHLRAKYVSKLKSRWGSLRNEIDNKIDTKSILGMK